MDVLHERDRLAALRQLEVLDTPAEERFDRVVRIAQRAFGVPMVSVNLIDEDRSFSKAWLGTGGGVHPRSDTFCSRTIESDAALVVPDLSADERFADNKHVVGEPHVRFYAGQPLAAPGGQRVGSLCILDFAPRTMTAAEIALLRDLADWVEHELASSADLVHARDVQRRLLPSRAPDVPGYDVAGRCLPARDLGGDYFDWHFREGELQFVVADVMGKGIGAALIAASVRSVLRGSSHFNNLTESVRKTAMAMEEDLTDTATFVTMFVARLAPETGGLEYVDAGHGLAIIIPAAGDVRTLFSDGLPLGALDNDTWTSRSDRLDPGDTLLVVSDGILDYFPDPTAAVKAAVDLSRDSRDAWEIVDRIVEVGMVAGYQPADDITAVVVRRAS
ncbi:putative Protein serine phosphatase with GAF(S) sensor(S) [metagenome]|uniref:PPM-type phosphatase domain-containing protein n=1 Tax=metagenome TaxID=256318 RepID=A0A2P2C1B0_9ZZZZ